MIDIRRIEYMENYRADNSVESSIQRDIDERI